MRIQIKDFMRVKHPLDPKRPHPARELGYRLRYADRELLPHVVFVVCVAGPEREYLGFQFRSDCFTLFPQFILIFLLL